MSFNVVFRKKGQQVTKSVDSVTWNKKRYVPESGNFITRFPVIAGGFKAIRNFKESHPEFQGGFITFLEFGTVMELTVPDLPNGLVLDKELYNRIKEGNNRDKERYEKRKKEILAGLKKQEDPFWSEWIHSKVMDYEKNNNFHKINDLGGYTDEEGYVIRLFTELHGWKTVKFIWWKTSKKYRDRYADKKEIELPVDFDT